MVDDATYANLVSDGGRTAAPGEQGQSGLHGNLPVIDGLTVPAART